LEAELVREGASDVEVVLWTRLFEMHRPGMSPEGEVAMVGVTLPEGEGHKWEEEDLLLRL